MEDEGLTLWCGNLSEFVTEELLFELFNQAGPLQRVNIPKRDGRQQPFGFVTFKHECSVAYALKLFNKTKLFGQLLKLRSRDIANEVEDARSYNNRHEDGYRRNEWNERVNVRRLDFSEDTSSLRGSSRGYNNKNTIEEMMPQPGIFGYVQSPPFDINTLLQLGQQMFMPQCPPLPGLFGQVPLMMYPSQLGNQLYGGALTEQPNSDLREQLEIKRSRKQAQSRQEAIDQGTYSGHDRSYDHNRSRAEYHDQGRRRSPVHDEYISHNRGSYHEEGPDRSRSPIHDEYNSRNRGGYPEVGRERSHTPIHDEYNSRNRGGYREESRDCSRAPIHNEYDNHHRGEFRHQINYPNFENHRNRIQQHDEEHVRNRDHRNELQHSRQSVRDNENMGQRYSYSRRSRSGRY